MDHILVTYPCDEGKRNHEGPSWNPEESVLFLKSSGHERAYIALQETEAIGKSLTNKWTVNTGKPEREKILGTKQEESL